ncbi:hypothetical protein G6F40_013731 [Rhizopus arrhizus]|nr:hypothetical protein G6F40_013731 [Rhizopus arrhizus]
MLGVAAWSGSPGDAICPPIGWTPQGRRLALFAYAVAIIRPFFNDHPPSTNSVPSCSIGNPASLTAFSKFGQSWPTTSPSSADSCSIVKSARKLACSASS